MHVATAWLAGGPADQPYKPRTPTPHQSCSARGGAHHMRTDPAATHSNASTPTLGCKVSHKACLHWPTQPTLLQADGPVCFLQTAPAAQPGAVFTSHMKSPPNLHDAPETCNNKPSPRLALCNRLIACIQLCIAPPSTCWCPCCCTTYMATTCYPAMQGGSTW